MVTRTAVAYRDPQRVLVFGSQALSLDVAALESIHSTISNSQSKEWLLSTIGELPELWKDFVAQFPKHSSEVNSQMLSRLVEWTETGELNVDLSTVPSIILSPLLVVMHLTEYLSLYKHEDFSYVEALGFCTGLLGAIAVSLSQDTAQLKHHGANVIRLAMIIGGIVDTEDQTNTNGKSKCLAAAWNSAEARLALDTTLAQFSEAYISVTFDKHRVTITTADKTAAALQRELRKAGIITTEVSLRGRFHSAQYADIAESLAGFCSKHSNLSLPDASKLVSPLRSTEGSVRFIASGPLHVHAIRAILSQHCQWYDTFQDLRSSRLGYQPTEIIYFGRERCVPQSILNELDSSVTKLQNAAQAAQSPHTQAPELVRDDIAVIGMSIKVAGADDVSEFFDLLMHGDSQAKEVPVERIKFETAFREKEADRKWFANLINDSDAFDHKFFKKSAREAVSMDPQQRHMLQSAYQALEQSGYMSAAEENREKSMGCYIGVCSADYENNVASHPATAFTATGNLKSFIAGKIAHYFGWTSTAMCIDTACSSSLVAVHLACKAILSGECRAALAGGANIMTNPLWFQNLAAASFLSKTGQCKPFDDSADGYCRGEGFASVVLKRLSAAVADGDQVLGVIPSTAVLQNQNCTPIFVPNSPSLSDLFRKVLKESALEPSQIGYIEAHGTGTQVGDPAEYESIKNVLGGKQRSNKLVLGSTKGLVGHTECTSGVVSLVKSLLVVGQSVIPPQRSFTKVNPHLNMQSEDNIEIVTQARKWDSNYRAALINNYGASGSNASMIVAQAPKLPASSSRSHAVPSIDVPFRVCGKDVQDIRSYVGKLRQTLLRPTSEDSAISVSDLSFNVCRQSNPSLGKAWIVSSRTKEQLMQQLAEVESHGIDPGHIAVPANRPVILCFGGQISTWVGLSRDVYDGVAVFRGWLDECDKEVRANGCDSIFPGVFERDPITDPVKLQTMLFATQYACAKTWSDCGVQPVAVVGHSFGELTSLCISGVLSLQDTVKLIAGRARIIKELWGDDSGSMIAIETDIAQVQAIISEAQGACDNAGEKTPTIACFNGPTSFTVAGSTKAIDLVAQILVQTPRYTGVRHKRLNVTNAFHSTLVEPLKQQLVDLGRGLNFNAKPTIPLERATESQSIEELTAQYIADHMRNPVYFDHAVQRLVRKYPGAVWLEAGSNSTITNMASRALGQPKGHFFQPVNINSNSGLQFLTTATMGLWGEGLSQLTFWAHHRKQTYDYVPMLLPAYQFEKSRHWVELKVPQAIQQATPENQDSSDEVANTLWTFAGFQDEKNHSAKFVVNSESAIYKELMSGHLIAKTAPILPATVIVQIVVDALASVLPDVTESGLQPVLTNVENQSPVCVDPSRTLSIEVQAKGESIREWNWQLISTGSNKTTTHAVGAVVYISPEDAQSHHEFGRCERLISHKRCARLLQDDESDIIQGRRHIYKAFSDVVDYPEPYQGVTKLVGGDVESAGLVAKSHSVDGWVDPHLSDSFSQVGGIWVNSMSNSSTDDMFLATGFEKWMRNPRLSLLDYRQIKKWDVFGTHQAESENVWISDLFIFNSATGKLAEVILGIHYHRVAKSSMSKILQRLSHSSALTSAPVITGHDSKDDKREVKTAETLPGGMAVESAATVKPEGTTAKAAASSGPSEGQKVVSQARALLADMAGIEGNEINATTQLADIGIDSLMGMELARELEGLFKCKLPVDDLMEVYDFGQLARLVQEKLGVSADEEVSEPEKAVDSSDDDSGYGSRTPASTLISESHVAVTHDNARSQSLELSPSIIMEAFEETKKLTDDFITDYRCAGYMENVLPRQTQLCIALTLDALDKLGYPLRTAKPGQRLTRIPCIKEQILLSNHLYGMLEKEARLIDVSMEGSEEVIVRTAMSATPYKSISGIMAGLDRDFPDHKWANELTHFAGSQLAEVLSGGQDGLKLIFGTEEGRKLVTGLYGDSLLNKLANVQMQDVIARLISKMPKDQGPLKILELGAGTGGTSKGMAAMLAKLNVPVEYTFTDLSGSFVAQARKAFKEYPFMKFRVHNIEHVPADELIGTQHIVLGSNAIHATHNLQESTKNVHKMLRPDGFLMMLEMTDPVYWVDMIFGLFEGWWLFEDGRSHAIAHESVWERDLHSAGYGHVDWTDGHLPEIKIQKVFLAMASGPRYDRQPLPHRTPVAAIEPPTTAQIATVEAYVTAHTRGFNGPATLPSAKPSPSGTTVMVTGASGSLGTHLVALLASLPTVKTVVCLNRRSTTEPELRQQRAMSDRGILLDAASQAKLQVIQTDTAKPQLGLSPDEYERLVGSVTHIVHNAWPMSGKRPLAAMESQFTVMRNLVDLASDIAGRSHARVGFQLVSSIAVVGHYPLLPTGDRIVPEVSMPLDAVLPNGYGEAKFVCERILDQTLHRFPDRFHTMSARLGQVGGSRVSGYWNPVEHLAFLFKSSQTLRAFPAFEGDLCWTPVEDVAGTLADLLLYDGEAPASKFYHVDNPVRQPWAEMVPVLVDALGIPADGVVPFDEWVRKVRAFPGAVDSDNPAARLVEFLDDNFLRMSCGGLLLDTKKSCEHSPTLRAVGPISPSLARKYIQAWKGIGFLN